MNIELGEDCTCIVPVRYGLGSPPDIAELFETLLGLDDAEVLRILTFIMVESLSVHSPLVDVLGERIGTDMGQWWQPDETFFALLRDKGAINVMLREVAGDITADAHIASATKVQKKVIADCLTGEGRPKVDGWLPRYMQFPARDSTGPCEGQTDDR